MNNLELLGALDGFEHRHIGPSHDELGQMLTTVGVDSLDALMDATIPASIRLDGRLNLPDARSESEVLAELRSLAEQNSVYRSFIGMGYSDCLTPPVIQRNILENPGWYTAYTPYQAEIAQGRMEALLNFQTMVCDLTGLDIANASMLDEGTSAAEAMVICKRAQKRSSKANVFFVSEQCHPQTIDVVRTRAEPLGYELMIGNHEDYDFSQATFGVLLQYPTTEGDILDYTDFCAKAHEHNALVVVAADLLALTLLRPPGEFGADIAVGNTQRFGVSLGYGGPHAAYMAVIDKHKRLLPGRLVGVSVDANGEPAMRLTLQAREQHIRRDKATSNICTAQVLLAVMASMYAVYHGPDGLKRIAQRVRLLTSLLAQVLTDAGYELGWHATFDTLKIAQGQGPQPLADVFTNAEANGVNLRLYTDGADIDGADTDGADEAVGVSLDETTTLADLDTLAQLFGCVVTSETWRTLASQATIDYTKSHQRTSDYLTHPSFNSYHSETEMLRYMHRLQAKDLSLTHSMIPLGSCTMKLNATTEMLPVTWPEFGAIHPFAPLRQTQGYQQLFANLEAWLAEITGFAAISLQPNAGSQGEYAGLMAIRGYHKSRGDTTRTTCLIPSSAHGTNPASAVMAGMDVVVVACDDEGNVDMGDLRAKVDKHNETLAALMVTYPSTHGVFEESIVEICQLIHDAGGQVYMDGANMNAQVGLCRPGDFGADVCHLNLHKTFCIPHGGGGPGMGPIGVAAHLAPFLPGHAVVDMAQQETAVSAAPWGSASILPISYAYIRMMGVSGLTEATKVAILNANYIANRLEPYYPVLYQGRNGFVAHECIVDLRGFKEHAEVDDVAKRLIDYGFHAPTVHWPVAGTMMIEPTESESKAELDRFCDAMIAIHSEIMAIANGEADAVDNALKNAPHTAATITGEWGRAYAREQAAFPAPWVKAAKFWPAVGRVDNAYGDRNLVCTCPPLEDYA
ncbi:MAG: aminomethyl-transferring glycine dehydrogenase [Chloroflexota bacterium]